MKSKNTTLNFITSIIILLVFQQTASKVGGAVANLFDYSLVDVDNTFMWISVHHIIQMLIAIIAIFFLYKKYGLNFCMRPRFVKIGIKYVTIFSVVIFIYVMGSYIIGNIVNSIAPYNFPLNITNVLGTIGFQFLLSGTSEEILFRALPVTVFSHILNRSDNEKSYIDIICAALLFSVAHISWSVVPFSFSANWFQLMYALILGIIYGITYKKTKSIIYPMLMHSLSNVFMVGTGYIFSAVLRW